MCVNVCVGVPVGLSLGWRWVNAVRTAGSSVSTRMCCGLFGVQCMMSGRRSTGWDVVRLSGEGVVGSF